MHRRVALILLLLALLPLAGCSVTVDPALPRAVLDDRRVAAEVGLLASPNHAAALLDLPPLVPGDNVRVLGSDPRGAYLLVERAEELGWLPSMFLRTGVGTLEPTLLIDTPGAACTEFLGATLATDETWSSTVNGDVLVAGTLYRPAVEPGFDASTLALAIDGPGAVANAAFAATPLTPDSAIVLFGFALTGVEKGTEVSLNLEQANAEPLAVQAAFFRNHCPDQFASVLRLPIGQTSTGTLPGAAVTSEAAQPDNPSAADEPAVEVQAITVESYGPGTDASAGGLPLTASAYHPATSSIWDRVDFRDLRRPGQTTYQADVDANEQLRWGFEWCAVDAATLDRILEPLRVTFFIDGTSVPASALATGRKQEDNGWSCRYWSTLLADWPAGQTVELTINYSLSSAVDDGNATYLPGEYHQVIQASVR